MAKSVMMAWAAEEVSTEMSRMTARRGSTIADGFVLNLAEILLSSSKSSKSSLMLVVMELRSC